MSDEVKPESMIVFNSPDDVPVTADNKKFMGARRPGRPKGPDSVTEALKQQLGIDQNATKIAKNMIGIAQNTKRVNAAVIAAREIADRIDGKPVQGIAVMQVMDEGTAKRLIQLVERVGGFNAQK
jgi:hypothetical protein